LPIVADEDLSKLKIDRTPKTSKLPAQWRRYRWVIAGVLAVLAGLFLYRGVFSPTVKVEVATVSRYYPSQAFTQLNASGYVVAQRKAAVASKITSRLLEITVEEGSRVRKGDVIARLEGDDAIAARDQSRANLMVARYNLEQAKAELEDAAASFQREKDLLAKEFTSKAQYDAAEARYKKAQAAAAGAEAAVKAGQAALQAAYVNLEYTLIRAPFDAVVLTKDADVGDIITPLGAAANAKAAVVTIADMASLLVEADVSESNLGLVKQGQPCEIHLDAIPDNRFRGVVHAIVPTVDRTKATVMVKVRFLDKNPNILPEMSAKVAFLSKAVSDDEQKPRLAVNRSSLVSRDGQTSVFIVKSNRVEETPLRLGREFGEMVEVLEGVKQGDRVVLNPSKRLRDGSKVKLPEG
jgi:RND family efflux transporter MFP subunit